MVRPPIAKTIPHRTEVHGRSRVDPYHWVRSVDADPDVRAYLEAENEYAHFALSETAGLQRRLYEELMQRRPHTDSMVPGRRDDYYYYVRTRERLPYHIHCRRKGHPTDAPEEVILDLNTLATGIGYLDAGQVRVSPDHRFVAYGLDTTGEEIYRLYVKDLQTGEVIDDEILCTGGEVTWANDNATLLYNQRDSAGRPYLLWRHVVGRPGAEDVVVAHEPDIRFNLLLRRTLSGGYFLAIHRSRTTRAVRFLSADDPYGLFQPVAPRQPGLRCFAVHRGDWFYLAIDDTSKSFRVVRTPVDSPGPAHFEEIIPPSEDVHIHEILAFENHLVTFSRTHGLPTIRVDDLRTGAHTSLPFDEPTYAVVEKGNIDFKAKTLRVAYSSPATPTRVYDHDLDGDGKTLMKQDEVRGDFDRDRYVVERIWATAKDGERLPISLIRHRDVPLDGTAPCFLHGYGAYAVNADMSFYPDRLSLIDRGVVNAIAHVRGGGEFGHSWWDEGRLSRKTNTFEDFISCAEHLISEGYCAADRIVIEGGSAGGLLIGAVLNMRPDLFAGAVASVPFVDVTNTMLDRSLRMTSTEYEEWGDPADPEQFACMDAYSPYDNVGERSYPPMLITCGLNDTRVHFWGPVKWTAKLRASKTDDNLLMLKTQLDAGHFGPSDWFATLRETAFQYAFILKALGLHER